MGKQYKNLESDSEFYLFHELSKIIEQSQQQIAYQANSTLTMLFWEISRRINNDILRNRRAGYGKQILASISVRLEANFGKNFNEKNVRRMLQFAEQYPDMQIVVTLSRQLSWSHSLILIPLRSNKLLREQQAIYYIQQRNK